MTMVEPQGFPVCRKCGDGDLVPLSDFGSQGASVMYKAWVCTNPSCTFNLKIRNGEVFVNEPITDASMAPAQNVSAGGHAGFRSIR